MVWAAGTDVWVDFEGAEWPGEVFKDEGNGWVLCMIAPDLEWDFGSLSARMSPHQTVAVKVGSVRERNV